MLKNAVMKGGLRAGALALVLGMGAAPGCLSYPIEPQETRLTSTIVERLTQSSVDKIDILLVIDNSRSMADKQEILRLAVPDLVLQLVNPLCVCDTEPQCTDGTPTGEPLPPTVQPTDPVAECPPGSKREFDPIFDFHLGIVTSSVGGHGSDSCEGDNDPMENDHGWLVDRDVMGGTVPTWEGKKFLVWDPQGTTHTPPGEANVTTLVTNLGEMVSGAGEVGCGYEAQLEGWYRFLVDPDPYETITIETDANNVPKATLVGRDQTLIQMRTDFMRPDSLLAIVMLTDENDCSIRDGGQYYFAAQRLQPGTNNPYHLPKPRAACASNPNDPCCRSCGQPPGCLQYDDAQNCVQLCDESADDCSGALSGVEDAPNLRCFDQKRRFGIDFLYPIDRYVSGLTAPTVPDRNAQLVPNPVFSDLNPGDDNSAIRDPGLVFVAGIVGVPWQDIARRDANGQPDLLNGLDSVDKPVGGFQDANQMIQFGTWDIILGDPAKYVPPTDPLMIESVQPRSGANPITMDPLAPPGDPTGNAINGSEWSDTITTLRDDLQYACIFELPTPKDCTMALSCDCDFPGDNPLCWSGSAFGTTQYKAKGYPGIRELQVLKAAGSQGIVGSICPAQVDNAMLADFGYRPAINAIVERLKQALGGQCLPRTLNPDGAGQVQCLILEALRTDQDCTAVCSQPGRLPIAQDHPAVLAAKEDPLAATAQWNCFCEIDQLEGEQLAACQNDPSESPVVGGAPVNGWCYVDATSVPPIGNADIVENCPETERRIIRFVGAGEGQPGATLFITCAGD